MSELRPVAGPGQRLIPALIMGILQERFPRLIHGVIENGDEVYLVMTGRRGRPPIAVRYLASPEFLTACRVADSDPSGNNLKTLCGTSGFHLMLYAPRTRR
jgi:hypothetical protein